MVLFLLLSKGGFICIDLIASNTNALTGACGCMQESVL